jgi:phosphonate transport system substrate-binding protein
MKIRILIAIAGFAVANVGDLAYAAAPDCPNDGTVRFGVEPFEAASKLVPIYERVGQLLAKQLDCEVKIFVTSSYTAEVEAMRAGPARGRRIQPFQLHYVLAHQLAKADVVATFSNAEGKPPSAWLRCGERAR